MKILCFIADLVRLIRFFIGGVFFLVLCLALFLGQLVGKDVIIQTSEYGWPFALSILALVLASYFTWYSSRLTTYTRKLRLRTTWLRSRYRLHVPRLLAVNLMGIVQIAHLTICFDLLKLLENKYSCYRTPLLLTFILLVNLLYVTLVKRFSKKTPGLPALVIICALFLILLSTGIYLTTRECLDLNPVVSAISICLILLLQVLAIHFFVYKGKHMSVPLRVIWKWKIPLAEKYYFLGLNLVAGISFVFYVLLWFNGPATFAGSFAIALFAISLLIGIINFITFVNTLNGINITVLILLWAVIAGFIWDKYKVNLIEPGDEEKFIERPDLQTYLYKWLDKRKGSINKHPGKKFKMYFVIAEGGGSRSGYWTSSVLSTLEDATYSDGSRFSDHLLALSGASGGSQGNATFYSVLNYDLVQKGRIKSYDSICKGFSRSDFLSLALARMLCFDIYSHLCPFIYKKDRALALEQSYENIYGENADTLVSHYFTQPVSSVYDTSGRLPFFFMATTRVKDAKPAIISNVKLPANYYCVDLLNTICKKDMKLSTAVALSSRFPYLMPAGNIDNNYYVDGGYYDNYGSTAAGILYKEIRRIMNDSLSNDTMVKAIGQYRHKLSFSIIHITNSVDKAKRERMHPLVNDLAVPIKSIYSVQNSSTEYLAESLKSDFHFDEQESIEIFMKEEIPMNLVISEYYLNKMDKELKKIVIDDCCLKHKMEIDKFKEPQPAVWNCE